EWYVKDAVNIKETGIRCALVSTNSIPQGEQVGILWDPLFNRYGIKIHFAHRTFRWTSEARGRAHVHVVIIGFGITDRQNKRIIDYSEGEVTATVSQVSNISPYLVEARDTVLRNRA